MASSLKIEQAVRRIVDSGLLTEEEIHAVVDASESGGFDDGERLLRLLVKRGKLTVYQAKLIYAGKGRSLRLGNYVLLDKLGQGGMGVEILFEHPA